MFVRDKQKLLKLRRGQSVVEYMLFFSVITLLTLLSLCTFLPSMRLTCAGAFQEAIVEMNR